MYPKNRKAFTMIELVFVIVVIGILSAIAIPKFAVTRGDALITKAKATLASVRSSLATERQKRILRGEFTDIGDLGSGTTYAFSNFDNNSSHPVLEYPIKQCPTGGQACWRRVNATQYEYYFPTSGSAKFKLDNNRFVCDNDTADCEILTQ